jgi:hypothetical protein
MVFHGLRKSAVVLLLEAGATDAEAAAITGQSREMVAHYSRQVCQRKLAAAAILKWEHAETGGHVGTDSLQNSGPVFAKPLMRTNRRKERPMIMLEKLERACPCRRSDAESTRAIFWKR